MQHTIAALAYAPSVRESEQTRGALLRQSGPVVLVGHSYGGAIITAAATGNSNVKVLVYIAAIVPDEHETVGDVFQRVAPHSSAPKLQPDADGFLWIDVEAFRNAVAPDATSCETALMAATQKPIALKCLVEPMAKPAWKEKPSWFHDRREGHHGVARHPAIHRRAHEISRRFLARRSHTLDLRVQGSRRSHSRSGQQVLNRFIHGPLQTRIPALILHELRGFSGTCREKARNHSCASACSQFLRSCPFPRQPFPLANTLGAERRAARHYKPGHANDLSATSAGR